MDVYCVMVKDGGGSFLDRLFLNHSDASAYKESQGRYSNLYTVELWEVE